MTHFFLRRAVMLSTLFLFLAVTTGCKTKYLPEYPKQTVDQMPYKVVSGDKKIGAQPLYSSAESERYFGVDLIKRGVLAVFISAECTSEKESYIIERSKFSLGQLFAGADASRNKLGDDSVAQAIGLSGGLIAIPLSAKLGSNAKATRHSMGVKKLHINTVTQRNPAQGFVFFELPNKQLSLIPPLMSVEVMNPTTQKGEVLQIQLPSPKGFR